MYHPSKRGIYCDLCGREVLIEKDSITYYSINMKKVTSYKDRPNDISDALDLDFCEQCKQIIYERVHKVTITNNEKRDQYGRKHV